MAPSAVTSQSKLSEDYILKRRYSNVLLKSRIGHPLRFVNEEVALEDFVLLHGPEAIWVDSSLIHNGGRVRIVNIQG